MREAASFRGTTLGTRTQIRIFNSKFHTWGISSNGRARALHARGSVIDTRILHNFV